MNFEIRKGNAAEIYGGPVQGSGHEPEPSRVDGEREQQAPGFGVFPGEFAGPLPMGNRDRSLVAIRSAWLSTPAIAATKFRCDY